MLNIPEEVKELYRQNSIRKNLRIDFPNGERTNLTNENLLAESFSFTESICSQSSLKFGLCEASVVEFECFGVEDIKGCKIEVYQEIDISDHRCQQANDYELEYQNADEGIVMICYGDQFEDNEATHAHQQIPEHTLYYVLRPDPVEVEPDQQPDQTPEP